MFALIAAILLFLAALDVHIGSINVLYLGLAFWALHFAFAWVPWPTPWRRNPP